MVTVTAASAGVTNAQEAVLHSLYGIGTDVTVTAPPSRKHGSSAFNSGSAAERGGVLSAGDTGLLSTSSASSISQLRHVAAAAGGLTLTDLIIPSFGQPGSGGKSGGSGLPATISVDGVDLAHLGLGPFGSAKVGSGRTFSAADATLDVAVADSGYAAANKLKAG